MSVDVAAIRAALAKATPGPWDAEDEMIGAGDYWIFATGLSAAKQTAEQAEADADLIVLLRNNAEGLLDALELAHAASEDVDTLIAQAERRGAVKALRSAAAMRAIHTREAQVSLLRSAESIENGADL